MRKTFVLGLVLCAAFGVPAGAAARQDGDPASVYYRDGARFALQGRLQEAARAFEQAVALDPRNGNAFYSLGNVYAEMGRWADAVAAYRKAVSLNKNDVEAFNGLGVALARRGVYEQAAAAFERAIEIYPKWAEPHFHLSQVRKALGREPEARASYQQAVRLRPDYAARPPQTLLTAGTTHETEARSERVSAGNVAAAGSRTAANNAPAANAAPAPNVNTPAPAADVPAANVNPPAASANAPTANVAGPSRGPRAAEAPRRVERPADADAQAYFNSGLKHGRAGRHDEAVTAFRQAVLLDREHAGAYLGLGDAYAELGRWRESLDAYERAARLNPNDPETHRRLGRAYAKLRETAPAAETAAAPPAPEVNVPAPAAVRASAPPANLNTTATPERPAPPVETPAKSAPAAEAAAARADADPTAVYRVGPGDVLDVRVSGGRQPLAASYKVSSTGLLDHPLLAEPLRVEGLTTEQVASRLGAELRRRAGGPGPEIVVGVREYASHAIIVSGMVRDAGTKILQREGVPLYVIIAHAQPLPGAGQALVRSHATGQHTAVDLSDTGAMNLLVRPGDVVTVRARPEQFFYIAGAVREPGQKKFNVGLTLTQAILAAGGSPSPAARVRVARQGADGRLAAVTYDLRDIAAGRAPDPPVQPGDRIEVLR